MFPPVLPASFHGLLYWLFQLAVLVFVVGCGGGGQDDGASVCRAIVQHPVDQTVSIGSAARFDVQLDGGGASFQWQRLEGSVWRDITGQTASSLVLPAVTGSDTGTRFRVLVLAVTGLRLVSNAAVLTVQGAGVAPRIVEQPRSLVISEGATAIFRVAAAPTNVALQWQRLEGNGWRDEPGGTGDTFIIANTSANQNGLQVRVLVRASGHPELSSDPATLTVITATPSVDPCTGNTEGWCRVHPTPAAGDLRAVGMGTGTAGMVLVAVGEGGALLRSTDRGTTWSPVARGNAGDWRGVAFATPRTAIVVGDGTILRSTDSGASWGPPFHVGTRLHAVAGGGAVLLAVGDSDLVLRSEDEGASWQAVGTPLRAQWLAVAASAEGVGLMAGVVASFGAPMPVVQRSVDAGRTWLPSASPGWPVRALGFLSPTVVIAVGDNGQIARSGDAGVSWTTLPADPQRHRHLNGLAIDSAMQLIASDDAGRVWTSSDEGQTWTARATTTNGPLLGVAFDAGSIVAVGSASVVVQSEDGGTTWRNRGGVFAGPITGVAFATSQEVWATAGSDRLLRSVDGGITWTAVPVPALARGTYHRLSFGSATQGLLVGSQGTVLRTIDGGQSFSRQTVGTAAWLDVALNAVGRATMVGEAGGLAQSTDGGATWVVRSSGTTASLNAVGYTSGGETIAVGGGGLILRIDGDGQVRSVPSPVSVDLYDVAFEGNVGIAVGDAGTLLRTVDGGASWSAETAGVERFTSVSFAGGPALVFAVRLDGAVFRSENGGMTWRRTDFTAPRALYGVSFSSSSTGLAIGAYGQVLRTTTGGQGSGPGG